jgi:SET domain
MYSQYLVVEDTKIGKGTFTTVQIPVNSMIIELSGPVVVERDIPPADLPNYLQIGPNTFMGPSGGGMPEYLNHSCDPNCKIHIVGNRAFLYSLYVIPINNELTFDYSSTSTDSLENWQMLCKCSSPKCRKVISGAKYLPSDTYDQYKIHGMFPLYITEPGILQKK